MEWLHQTGGQQIKKILQGLENKGNWACENPIPPVLSILTKVMQAS